MKKFKELSKEPVDVVESEMIDYWKKHKVFEKSIENRDIKNTFVFYDGPATANGHPGLHHMVAKFLKDTFTKYHVMKGERVIRKVGWDTHGLPVELEVEKELGFNNKNDIEKYGIEPFNAKCKESVRRNEKTFTELTDKMGQFIDTEHPYVTYDNNYIETEWWILKKFFDEGLFYEGSKILPFCTRCGTGLASHEVAQGYEEIEVETVIVPMKLKDRDAYFLVWTTTPWTLLANVALCVNPKYDYVEVKSKGYTFILCKTLLHQVLGDDVEIIKEYKGTDLEGWEYDQLLPFLETKKKGFFVCCDEYVTDSDGTGIVHIAPAFGADDAEVGKKYNLPYLNPVGEDGCYTEGPWKGMYIFDADKEVIKWLKENDKLFKKQKMVHNYPHCWRCHTPLLYYSKPSYYLEITKIKDKIVKANKTVNWFPSYVGEKRFGNWLEELKDWALSRQRYWGTPLPLWICDCGHEEMIGSREELAEKAIEKVDPKTIDLHRPFVDDIHLTCPKCGGKMTRTTDVIDCWFDSGAMPFSQYHYPFENKELWENQFPADFICEGIDQTRGWFYSLMVISVFVTGKSPYKNVLVNDLLLDKDGKKMSKSKGNIVEPFTTMKTYGADGVRWYLPYVSPVWTPLKFDVEGIKDINSKFFNTLKNTYTFFEMYANTDEVDPRTFDVDYKDLEDIDKWLLSKYNNLVKDVTEVMDVYDVNKAVHLIQYFVCEELSNWYIRRNRRRFWGSKLDKSKKAVYKTTYDVLVGLCKLIAPISPFISDEIYMNLTGEESVHLADFPVCNKKLINEKLEEKMDLVIELISITRNIREEAKIKVRQPISEVIFEDKYKSTIKEFEDLICEELNAKKVVWAKDMGEYLTVGYKPNFKEVGKTLGSNISKFQEYLKNITEEDAKLLEAGELKLDFDGVTYTIDNSYVLKDIQSKDGYAAVMINYKKVAINTVLTQDLINEGIAREIVSKIQNLRKTSNFDIADRIEVEYTADKEVKDALKQFKKYVMDEVLAVKLNEDKDVKGEELKINDYTMVVKLKQVK